MPYFALMFTGIIESTGIVKKVIPEGLNRVFWIESLLSSELKIDQSVCHSGVCLTVEETDGNLHRVTAVAETLKKTNLGNWIAGTVVNLERSLTLSSRLDGHFVQGHTDCIATCISCTEKNGSWEFEFRFPGKYSALIIEKGSICINGISLTAFNVKKRRFTVTIIPYTLEHTSVKNLSPGDTVNLEFDVIGKYIFRKVTIEKYD